MLRWKDKQLNHVDSQKILRNSGTYTILLLTLLAMTFFGVCSPDQGGGVLPSGAAAKVAGEKISPNEFLRSYNNTRQRMQSQYGEAFNMIAKDLPKSVLNQLVNERILFYAAKNAGIEAQEDDVLRLLLDAKAFQDEKGAFSSESYSNYLRSNGYTEKSFTDEIIRSVSVQNLRQFMNDTTYVSDRAAALDYKLQESKIDIDYLRIEPAMAKVDVSEEEVTKFLDDAGKTKVKDYYNSHLSEFNQPAKVKARHILVSFQGARAAAGDAAKRSKEDAQKRAASLLAKVRAAGADFAKIATAETDEPSGKTKGGDLGYFGKEDMVKEFSEKAFAMKEGEISDPVLSAFGYHIIRVEDIKPEQKTTLEAATPQIARKLVQEQKSGTALDALAGKILEEAKAGKDTTMKSVGAKWASTGPTNLSSPYFAGLGSDEKSVEAALTLKTPGQVYDKVLTDKTSKVVIKLKSRIDADEKTLTAEKKKELKDSSAASSAYSIMSNYEKSLRKELEEKGRIWENPKYLTMGQNEQSATGGPETSDM
jgi:peptidyl-prolyl cis-trans isomerase D